MGIPFRRSGASLTGWIVFLGLESPDAAPFYPVAKLGDFGLAFATRRSDEDNPGYRAGHGTPGYLAPEQRPQGHSLWGQVNEIPLSSYTNIWGIGAVMCEMITLHRHSRCGPAGQDGMPQIITSKFPEYSHALRSLVESCMHSDPKKRPLIHQLESHIDEQRRRIVHRRGENQTVPSEEERLYYRGNEIETMSHGRWQLSGAKPRKHRKSKFVDPDLGPIQYPSFGSEAGIQTENWDVSDDDDDDDDDDGQGEDLEVKAYGPDDSQSDPEGDEPDVLMVDQPSQSTDERVINIYSTGISEERRTNEGNNEDEKMNEESEDYDDDKSIEKNNEKVSERNRKRKREESEESEDANERKGIRKKVKESEKANEGRRRRGIKGTGPGMWEI